MDIVSEVLEKSEEDSKKYKPTTVEKHLELYIDLGTLLAIDENELDVKKLKSSSDSYLKSLARDNTQLLLNKVWELPIEKYDDVTVANLPKPQFILPRALPIPKPKAPTKWEKFAKEKGIVKKKKEKMKWDDVLQKWVPLFGFKRAEAEKDKNWIIEVPGNADPYEDQFAKKMSEKSEKVAKNEFQRLRNLAKAKNIKIPKLGFTPTAKPSPSSLGAALTVAKASTASLGKFQQKIPKEKDTKNVKPFLPGATKRKLPVPNREEEKKKNLIMVDNILNKKPKLNVEQAVEKEIHNLNREEASNQKPKKRKIVGKKPKKVRREENIGDLTLKLLLKRRAKKFKMNAKMRPRKRVGGKVKGGRKRR